MKSLAVKISDPDLWWHLANGRFMVENRVILREEVFSHTLLGAPWINFEWLGQILLYFLFRTAGMEGIFYGKVVLSLSAAALVVLTARRLGAKGVPLYLLAWGAFLVLRPRLHERIELISFIFLGLFVYALVWARSAPATKRRGIPWALGGVMIIWANIHAGFLYGLGVIVLLDIGARWSKQEKSYIRLLDRTLAVSWVAWLINPYGPRLSQMFLEVYLQMTGLPSLIAEWDTPAVNQVPVFWIFFIAVGGLMVWGLLNNKREAQFWTPAVIVFAAGAGLSYRSTALLAFAGIPFLAGMLSQRTGIAGRFRTNPPQPMFARTMTMACYALPFFFLSSSLKLPFPNELVKWRAFPVGACRFVEDQNIHGTMYNWYETGGYIAWALGPERKIYMDGRYLFHPLLAQERPPKLINVEGLTRHWQRLFLRYNVDYAIVSYPGYYRSSQGALFSPLNVMFPPSAWALVYWDDASLVFLKRTPAHRDLIRQFEYRFLFPYNFEKMRHMLQTGQLSQRDAEQDLKRHKSRVGFTVIGREIEKLLHEN